MAQPARPYPTPDSESTCHGLSESVVGFSGILHFTRLDSGEQCTVGVLYCKRGLSTVRPSRKSALCSSYKKSRVVPDTQINFADVDSYLETGKSFFETLERRASERLYIYSLIPKNCLLVTYPIEA